MNLNFCCIYIIVYFLNMWVIIKIRVSEFSFKFSREYKFFCYIVIFLKWRECVWEDIDLIFYFWMFVLVFYWFGYESMKLVILKNIMLDKMIMVESFSCGVLLGGVSKDFCGWGGIYKWG